MGSSRKASDPTITIKITKKAETVIRRYAREIPKKSGTGTKFETNLQVMDRIMLDEKLGYLKFKKPLHDQPKPAIARFQ